MQKRSTHHALGILAFTVFGLAAIGSESTAPRNSTSSSGPSAQEMDRYYTEMDRWRSCNNRNQQKYTQFGNALDSAPRGTFIPKPFFEDCGDKPWKPGGLFD